MGQVKKSLEVLLRTIDSAFEFLFGESPNITIFFLTQKYWQLRFLWLCYLLQHKSVIIRFIRRRFEKIPCMNEKYLIFTDKLILFLTLWLKHFVQWCLTVLILAEWNDLSNPPPNEISFPPAIFFHIEEQLVV